MKTVLLWVMIDCMVQLKKYFLLFVFIMLAVMLLQNCERERDNPLGRVLFYDTKLSVNNRISCGSCHLQELAFADGKIFSSGFNGEMTSKNPMALVNAIYDFRFFWNQRSNSLEE